MIAKKDQKAVHISLFPKIQQTDSTCTGCTAKIDVAKASDLPEADGIKKANIINTKMVTRHEPEDL